VNEADDHNARDAAILRLRPPAPVLILRLGEVGFRLIDRLLPGVVLRLRRGRTGQRRDGQVEIVEGLAAGDVIVTSGQLKVRDGTPVRILTKQASA
jgi:membrane fusion protein (multidrug efflux system)